MSARVLVVEDAPEYTQLIAAALRNEGFEVGSVSTLADARVRLRSLPPDVVVLDLTLPDGDGLDLCQEIRSQSSAYVLILSGRNDEVDKLVGFRLGADDYMTKPFSPRELAARVHALVGRARSAQTDEPSTTREVGDLVVDSDQRTVFAGDEQLVVTRIEFELLDALMERPGSVLTRAQLLHRVWGVDHVGDTHVVDVHIGNLRKKIDVDGAKRIRTVRGVGYAMRV